MPANPLSDPLKNPRPGDIVRAADGRERRVVITYPNGLTWVNGKGGGTCMFTGWRAWCRKNKAVVVERGEE